MAQRRRHRLDQSGLFGPAELFDENAAPVVYHGDPQRGRARLQRLIAEARASDQVPWDADSVRLYRKIVPQMSLWLPEEEGRQLVLQSRKRWFA